MITTLINKTDTFETVRDQIAAILLAEQQSQQTLATAASEDPRLWALRVFTERTNPISEFKGAKAQLDATPFVNVWWTRNNYEDDKSTAVARQWSATSYNIDCYGFGISEKQPTGHLAGDARASLAMQRAVRLVRNVLMAGEYTFLGLARGIVRKRWISNIQSFQPPTDDRLAAQVQAARIILNVHFVETTSQVQGVELDLLSATVRNAATGEIFFTADYDYTGGT